VAKLKWNEVKKEHVIKAIEEFLMENPEHPAPRSTFLIYKGKKMPAKHIRGMAYKVAFGLEPKKDKYSGGIETVRFFQRLGFVVSNDADSEMSSLQKTKTTKQQAPHEKTVIQSELMGKTIVTSKRVIEQKNALQLILNKMFDGDIVCEKTYSWLKTPETLEGEYHTLFNALSTYRGNTSFAKKKVILRCDFVCEGKKFIIEYDERQHFSEARKRSLESYKNIPLYYDRELWIKACDDIRAKDNSPINRDEIRAYYDSVRDIECFKHGYCLVRIMHGQIDFETSNGAQQLKVLINNAFNMRNQKIENERDAELRETRANKLKVCMYLQTQEYKNKI